VCAGEDLPEELSPIKRQARKLLLEAATVKTAAILLDQYQGALERTLAEIEVRQRNGDLAGAVKIQDRLEQTRHLAWHLVEPFRVVIAGPPNVGKSSLINAIAGYTRSVVSPMPGTTRDVVTTRIALEGWPVELIDTAGLHEGGDELERQGMDRARAIMEKADLRLWVLDASAAPFLPPPTATADGYIINKIDLPSDWCEQDLPASAHTRVSAKTGHGVADLCTWIGELLGLDLEFTPGEGVLFV